MAKKFEENKMDGRFQQPPPPVQIEDHNEYEVEKILDMRERKRGRKNTREFLVKWKGYPEFDAPWEPESHLTNAKKMLKTFLQKQQENDEDVVSMERE
jgi:hypothetical protein